MTGVWSVLNPGPTTSASGSYGGIYLSPIYLPYAITIDAAMVRCITGNASSSLALGVYDLNSATKTFTRLLDFGTQSLATSGTKIFNGSWTIPAGVHWLAWLFIAALTNVSSTNAVGVRGPMPLTTLDLTLDSDQRSISFTGAGWPHTSLPASFVVTAGMGNSTNPIRVGVRAV
jgi:hypothetical protein